MKDVDDKTWQQFRAGDRNAYERLVEHYLPLVKITIGRMAMNLPAFIDYEELYSTGCLGLLSAVERYDPGRNAKFTTYAITRIRGAVIDELRTHDTLGRVTRERVMRIREAEESFRSSGGEPSLDELAKSAGLSRDEYDDALRCERSARMISLSEPVAQGGGASATLADVLAARGAVPEEMGCEDEEIIGRVREALTDREKTLVGLYYHEELTLKEIGNLMGISESRVSQLHAEMVERIRQHLHRLGV